MDIIELIKESRATKGEGSKEGREAFSGKRRTDPGRSKDRVKGMKSKVRVYDTIMDALAKGFFGQIFSTVGSDRLYVITKQRWGTSDDQKVGDKVAKGFTPGSSTPGSTFKEIKGHAIRTMLKHGKQHSKRKEAVAKGEPVEETRISAKYGEPDLEKFKLESSLTEGEKRVARQLKSVNKENPDLDKKWKRDLEDKDQHPMVKKAWKAEDQQHQASKRLKHRQDKMKYHRDSSIPIKQDRKKVVRARMAIKKNKFASQAKKAGW